MNTNTVARLKPRYFSFVLAIISFSSSSVLITSVSAAPAIPFQGSQPFGITVTGHSEVKVNPDVATISLSIETTNRDEAAAVRDNATSVQNVDEALTKSTIKNSDVQTQSYTVFPNRDYSANPPVLTGYTVATSLRVTIHDIPKAGVIVDKATALGATVDDIFYDLVDKSHVQGEQLVAAVANARSKADLIAGASGVQVGRVLSITEQGAFTQPPQPIFHMAMAAAAPAQPSTQFSPQQIQISADVTATYSIEYTSP
jgi:uncharacterized protein YggE